MISNGQVLFVCPSMEHAFFLAPAGSGIGLTTVALGLLKALDQRGIRVAFFKPIAQVPEGGPVQS
jgi:phosphate acetyltransferase